MGTAANIVKKVVGWSKQTGKNEAEKRDSINKVNLQSHPGDLTLKFDIGFS